MAVAGLGIAGLGFAAAFADRGRAYGGYLLLLGACGLIGGIALLVAAGLRGGAVSPSARLPDARRDELQGHSLAPASALWMRLILWGTLAFVLSVPMCFWTYASYQPTVWLFTVTGLAGAAAAVTGLVGLAWRGLTS